MIKLNPGEVICDQCNGTGKPNNNKIESLWHVPWECDKCHGMGKLDWVENVVGKKEHPIGTIYHDTSLKKAFVKKKECWAEITSP